MNLNLSLEDTRSEIIDLLGRGEPDPNDDPVSSGGVEDVEWQPRSPKVLLWLAEQVVLGVGEHKDLSVREANYEKAAELRDLQEKLKRLFDELRRILDEGHADEQWPTGTEGGD